MTLAIKTRFVISAWECGVIIDIISYALTDRFMLFSFFGGILRWCCFGVSQVCMQSCVYSVISDSDVK
jgi:hypothetical protein